MVGKLGIGTSDRASAVNVLRLKDLAIRGEYEPRLLGYRLGALAQSLKRIIYPADTGFALKGWRKFQIDNAGIVITGNSAISMGNVTLWDAKGNMTKVDKTWAWTRGADGGLKIVLHHSSLPYSAK